MDFGFRGGFEPLFEGIGVKRRPGKARKGCMFFDALNLFSAPFIMFR
jgi:hypothetical protein